MPLYNSSDEKNGIILQKHTSRYNDFQLNETWFQNKRVSLQDIIIVIFTQVVLIDKNLCKKQDASFSQPHF